MTDVVVVLPGIGGSTLHDASGPVYEPSVRTLWRAARHRHEVLDALAPDTGLDDVNAPVKIRPDGLIGLPVAVPGLGSITGYQQLRTHLMDTFELTVGAPDGGGPPANYFEFAYDWRRDNRVNAELLRRLVDRELPRWSATLADGTAKVILVGHSMGGLVAKYYLDALDGWRKCRALITFGTPYRGSVKALDLLANGVRKAGVEFGTLSALLRGFTSVYQLLPRYPVVLDQRGPDLPTRPVRITELGADVGGLELRKAVEARETFQRMLDTDRSTHAGMPLHHLVDVLPVVGFGHPTPLSATLDSRNRLRCASVPWRGDELNPWHVSGDRTVPALSALPVELSESAAGNPVNDTHGTLHGVAAQLKWIAYALTRYGAGLSDQQHPAAQSPASAWQPAIGLDVDEIFTADEPVVVRCTVPPELRDAVATVTLGNDATAVTTVERTDDTLLWTAEGLPPGTHTVTVHVGDRSVSDSFEIG
ncbi:hypothetical protein AB0H83_29160 [Dactylosporangium sp. NPDC050688]|uniref:lipase/acyltransferase domain-containing protein n=1 Tax=Dactylosporangium sp. NPDC050688 TaxID=3157217 RepID=UPI003410FD1C